MVKGRPRAVQRGGLGQNLSVSSTSSLNIPSGPVYYPNEDEFKDPLEFIRKIRAEAEPYGICKIVPPKNWKPPFALNMDSFTFPTKTQAIHQLQERAPACDSKTFELEYNKFLEKHFGKKLRRKVVFEEEDLDLCKLFNAVKRYGGYDKVVKEKKWGEVSKFVRPEEKISECAKHVLSQLYREHLFDYEEHHKQLNQGVAQSCKRGMHGKRRNDEKVEQSSSKRRRRNKGGEKIKVCEAEEEHDQMCVQCRSGLHGELMLLCDRCNKGWHIYCLSPPLKQIPPGNWYCLDCVNSDEDSFGFIPGKRYSLEAFRRIADRAKKKWFGPGSVLRLQIEKKFWEIVEGSIGEVEVMYGSDLDTSLYGSGFPRTNDQRPEQLEAKVWDEYCKSPWNLNNLPKLKGSVLQAVHNNITGVMVPWLYIGMLFSSFCWHFEDHCFYSMNYLHWGEPKCWYSVPGSESGAFEKVMRKCLPDLFDAQPDLLFHLITMLNPSVLQENGVSVYSVLQEPGNFVITFPRSYHGGFNLGLNCAEAVNFAPADWLPHGGFGAELYKLYHKPAVLSHEELLCVIAKSDPDSRVSPYLKKELIRIYKREKTWREKLWRNGIVKSTQMSVRKCPEYVGTEEDPACIICRQYLYLSAVVCRCRPLTFVCLEHWKHLCECKSSKLRLLYRHSLAELNDLVLSLDKYCSDGTAQRRDARQQMYCSDEPKTLTKKVKNGHTTLAQLAEKWLVRSSKILQNAFSKDSYVAILKKAEQFLWAGSEMDPVREMAKNVIKAQKWAESIRDCLSKVENWSCDCGDGSEKVCMEYITKLLLIDPVPCNEPGHLKLKDYAKEAMVLIREIDTALSAYYKISDLELLHSKVGNLPIYVKESEKLIQRISSSKMCMESVRKCISEKCPAAVELEFLNKLKSEILELQIQFPEVDMLLDLLRQAELFRSQCCEILKGPITLKSAKELLQRMDDCTVNVPELRLLRQYHTDAVLWISRFNDVLHNIHERHNQDSVVDELNCILEVGASLRIQVDELPLVRIEIKNACCRKKALKARDSRVSMDCLQQLIVEAKELGIESENLYLEMSQVLVSAVQWEEKAKDILGQEAEVFEFEDLIRSSDEIFVILPSLDSVKLALSTAISWLKNSELFLTSCSQLLPVSSSLLKLESLKELVSQSKLLKVSLKERRLLETVLRNCEEWEHGACSLLQDIWCLLNMTQNGDGVISGVISEIEHLVTRIESTKNTGLSLGFDLNEIPKLEDACNTLQWCRKALFFCSVLPPYKDVENLVLAAEHLPGAFVSSVLCSSLINGVKWLKQASEVLFGPWTFKRFKLSDVEEVLTTYKLQCIAISFPVMVGQLEIALQKHKLWQDQVHQFFSLELRQRSWTSIMMLKEVGTTVAFDCSERDSVFSEVEKVEKWKQHCINIMGTSVGAQTSLLRELQKIRDTLDRSLYMYDLLSGSKKRDLCLCCFNDSPAEKLLICASCKDCYHLQCLGLSAVEKNEAYECSYCLFLKGGSTSGSGPLKFGGNCPELKLLVELLSHEDKFSVCVEEQEILNQVVEKALSCRSRLAEIINSVQGYFDEDLSMIHTKLTTALKATDVAGIYDDHWTSCELKLALARSSWKVCVKRLLEGLQKPAISQIQQHFKEGVALNIPPEDHYRQQITAVKHVGLKWLEYAKKVAADSGALSLDKVFELIKEGENLPVCVEKELELLRARSMLYCICRKPYDQRAMIACDQCDEWYHFDCIKLIFIPKVYICPACEPQNEDCLTSSLVDHERLTDATSVEPKTPSPQHAKSRKSTKRIDSSLTHETLPIAEGNSTLKSSSGIERLWWRKRKPFRRAAKKREELDSLSPFFHLHN